jgi:peptidoglycan/LPS O-acetylase OafA/YrhL
MILEKWLTPKPAEWPVLAVVRFFMALAVVVYHLSVARTRESVPYLDQLGGLGCICGFLCISGYSIAHSVKSQPKGFYARRAWRIFPLYYVSLGLTLLPYWFATPASAFRQPFPDYSTSQLVGSLFLLQCWVTQKIPIFGPSWTLAVEWWFYVLAPLFIRLPKTVLALIVFASMYFQGIALQRGYFPVHNYEWGIPAMMLLWAWLSGFLFYTAKGWSSILLVLVGYYVMNRFNDLSHAAYLVAAFAVVIAKGLPRIPAIVARFFNYLGDLSYPLYLVHVPVLAWVGRYTDWDGPYTFIGVSIAVSAFLFHAVDNPLRSRFSSRHGKKAPSAGATLAKAAAPTRPLQTPTSAG